jgi:hypothetical protein
VEDVKLELGVVVAHLWLRRIDEVVDCISCRRRVTGGRSVGDMLG